MSEADEHNLPGLISSIAVQQRNKERYTIFVDKQYLMGISEETLIKYDLRKSTEITPDLFRELQRHEGRFTVKKYLLKLLGRRAHARKELMTKALQKEYPREIITNVLNELEQKGYIDDADFARKFAKDKFKLNKWGPSKIKAHLLKKGIHRSNAEESIRLVFSDEDLEETFIPLVLKRRRHFLREEHPLKRKKKVISYLARKGYRASDIYDSINKLMRRINNENPDP